MILRSSDKTQFKFKIEFESTALEADGTFIFIPNRHCKRPSPKILLHPNPFNSHTTISFEVEKPSRVELTIYDARGRKVDQILNIKMNKGEYQINYSMNTPPTGIYFCRLSIGEVVEIKRMIYLK